MTIDSDFETWGGGNWTLTINGTDYSEAFQMADFTESINQPVEYKIDVQGIASDNTDISKGNIVKLEYSGSKAFKGRIVDSSVSSDLVITLEGVGMAFDLLRRTFTKNYNGSNTDTIVSEVVGSTTGVGTNTRLNSTDGAVDFRLDEEKKLGGINRLVGQYGGEWWVDEDNNNNDQLNVDTKRGGGSAIKTFRTSGTQKNAAVAEKNTSAGSGDYDGVVVKGYGDGDDQIKATSGAVGDEDEVLVYTDKTITSSGQAQDKADSLKSLRVDGDWTEITIVPADPNEIFTLGEVFTVDSSDADITSTNYRLVERNYTVDFQGEIEAELVLNNRPATVMDGGLAETREETKSQAEYMQGNRNTINESNSEISDDSSGTTLELNVPQRFVQDINNQDRTAQVRLDIDADDYKKILEASDVEANDGSTTDVFTEVDDFGDVDPVNTERRASTESNSAVADLISTEITASGGSSVIQSGEAIVSSTKTVSTYNTFTEMETISLNSTDTQGIFFSLYGREKDSEAVSNDQVWFRVEDESDSTKFPDSPGIPTPAGTEPDTGAAQAGPVTIFVPRNTSGKTFNIEMSMDDYSGSSSEEDWELYATYWTIGQHTHSLPDTPDGADRVTAYMADTQGDFINASRNSSQNTQSLPDTSTVTLGQLDNNDLVLTKQSSSADQVRVYVNGNEISQSPITNLGSDNLPQKSDIDITSDVKTPGFNTIEVRPEDSSNNTSGKAFVKANAIVDHKIDGER